MWDYDRIAQKMKSNVDGYPLDCRSPCDQTKDTRGWRDQWENTLSASATTPICVGLSELRGFCFLCVFLIVLVLLQFSVILTFGFKYYQLEEKLAQHDTDIKRLQEQANLHPLDEDRGKDNTSPGGIKLGNKASDLSHGDDSTERGVSQRQQPYGDPSSSWTARKLLRSNRVLRQLQGSAWKPGIHLEGDHEASFGIIHQSCKCIGPTSSSGPSGYKQSNDVYLPWREPDWTFNGGGLDLTTDGLKITITQSGLYLVYSQITVNGRRYTDGTSYRNPSSGYETVRIRDGQTRALLTSVITQDGRGHFYSAQQDGNIYPLDTLSHTGIFYLNRGDKLGVRTGQYAQDDRYTVDRRYNYFGAILLNSA